MKITKEIFFSCIEALRRQEEIDKNVELGMQTAFGVDVKPENNILKRQILDLLRLEFPRSANGYCDIEEYCYKLNFGFLNGEKVVSLEELWFRVNEEK